MSAPFVGRPLPEGFQPHEVQSVDGGRARLGIRFARAGELVDAYPAGILDREINVEGNPPSSALARFTEAILAADPRCRRVVFAVPERDLDAISWSEAAGYRHVVDVETRSGAYSLLVSEPEWVLEQPHALDDIPLKE